MSDDVPLSPKPLPPPASPRGSASPFASAGSPEPSVPNDLGECQPGEIWLANDDDRPVKDDDRPDDGCSDDETPAAREAIRRRQIRRHWAMLGLCSFVVLGACLLTVRDGVRVAPRFAPEFLLPETCGTKILFGTDCPGCGLTRGFIHLARGEWSAAWLRNRMTWPLAIFLLAQFPFRAWRLVQLRHGPTIRLWWTPWISYSLIACLAMNWVLKKYGI